MKYTMIALLLLVSCAKKEEVIDSHTKMLKHRIYKVNIDGIECIVLPKYHDGSGFTGITCNWK